MRRASRFDLITHEVRQTVRSPLLGWHNMYNVLAAAAIAHEHGITPSETAAALPSLEAADKRGQVVKLGNITVLYDCYNSSPKALMATVDMLAGMPARRRIVVAGEMLELGATRRAVAPRKRGICCGKERGFSAGRAGIGESDGGSGASRRGCRRSM